MPPRPVVVLILAAWLAAVGWLVAESWLPWWQSSDEPAFAVDLADEVAPQHAVWIVTKEERRLGSGESRLTPRKDGTFELTTRFRELELRYGPLDVRLPLLLVNRILSREGKLISIEAKLAMKLKFFGTDVPLDATVKGQVENGFFVGECVYDTGSEQLRHAIEPIAMSTRSGFSSLEPMTKYGELKPGQSWRVTHVDVVGEAFAGAVKQVVARMFAETFQGKSPIPLTVAKPPTELLARVQTQTEEVTIRGVTHTCRVIVFQGERSIAKTWVAIEDGRVLKQEALSYGEIIVLLRD